MRILVVNAFQVDEEGVKSIIEFEEMVREQIKNQKGLVDTETEICLKDKDSLDDILYEPESGFLNRNAAMAFDTYDMIFLSGSAHILPWNKSVSKVLFCKKNKKLCLFFCLIFQSAAYGASSHVHSNPKNAICMWFRVYGSLLYLRYKYRESSLVYYIFFIIHEQQNINVLNGKGKGSSIRGHIEVEKDLRVLDSNDYVLDNVTGDMYQFNYDTKKWVVSFNAGIHFQKAAEDFKSIGKFVMSAPQHRTRSLAAPDTAIVFSKRYETLVTIRKQFVQHWALIDVPSEVLVELRSNWQVHPFNFLEETKSFMVLGTSNKGPQVILFTNQNLLATQFLITKRYPSSLCFLRNFIIEKMSELRESPGKVLQILSSYDQGKKSKQKTWGEGTFEKENQEKVLKLKNIMHSGFSIKNRGRFVVENNAVGDRSTIDQVTKNSEVKGVSLARFDTIRARSSEKQRDQNNKLRGSSLISIDRAYSKKRDHVSFERQLERDDKYISSWNSNREEIDYPKNKQPKKDRENIGKTFLEILSVQKFSQKSRIQVFNYVEELKNKRKTLLPCYNGSNLEHGNWVPGFLTSATFFKSISHRKRESSEANEDHGCRNIQIEGFQAIEEQEEAIQPKESGRKKIKSPSPHRFYCRHGQFERIRRSISPPDKVSIARDSPYDNPQLFKIKKSPMTFHPKQNFLKEFEIPNYIGTDPSPGSTLTHQFRSEKKKCWVSKKNFQVF